MVSIQAGIPGPCLRVCAGWATRSWFLRLGPEDTPTHRVAASSPVASTSGGAGIVDSAGVLARVPSLGHPTALLAPGMFVLRPQAFTYLPFVITLLLLNAAERGRLRWLWGIPPVFALWANLHRGVLAGMGIVIVWSAARVAASC